MKCVGLCVITQAKSFDDLRDAWNCHWLYQMAGICCKKEKTKWIYETHNGKLMRFWALEWNALIKYVAAFFWIDVDNNDKSLSDKIGKRRWRRRWLWYGGWIQRSWTPHTHTHAGHFLVFWSIFACAQNSNMHDSQCLMPLIATNLSRDSHVATILKCVRTFVCAYHIFCTIVAQRAY